MDLNDVQTIVNKMDDEIKALFNVKIMAPETVSSITTEVADLQLLQWSVLEATDWACPTNSTWWQTSINDIWTHVKANLTNLETLTEAEALEIQYDIEHSNTSWMGYFTMHQEFNDLVNQFKEYCGGSSFRTVTAYWDPALAGGDCNKTGADATPQILVAEGRSAVAGSCYDGQCQLTLLCIRRNGQLRAEHHVGAPCSRDYDGAWVSTGCSAVAGNGPASSGQCCFF
jgi:hypothetical protein